jgi:hypothetical protein
MMEDTPNPSDASPQKDIQRPPNLLGRNEFLIALQLHWPEFWKSLSADVWLAPGLQCPWSEFWNMLDGGQADAPNDPSLKPFWDVLFPWTKRHNVVDDWMLNDAVAPTIRFWERYPDSRAAKLEPRCIWFRYEPSEELGNVYPEFAPVFISNRPIVTWKGGIPEDLTMYYSEADAGEVEVESLDDFEARMMRQFKEQLKDYRKKAAAAFRSPGQQITDAEWTALRFSGKGPAEIVSTFSASRAVAYEVPEQVVRIAVKRFATDIGLTLPKSST